ncbi:MAG: DUF1553 domain-containing protein, partial [Planctomycetes bacterium]|nr:DUF1553 domain-containing protein [Planctomycetota bacterium]
DLLSNRTVTPGCAPHVTLLLDAYHVAAPARRQLAAQLAPLKKKEPAVTKTLVLGERAKPLTTHIHLRGDFRRPGAAVTPNVPRILPPLQAKKPTRLDFARWLVSPENPLTARVLVNRVWQPYFGVGLVETENDFGTQGTPPTHPELLDWLASELMAPSPRPSPPGGEGGGRGGWSLKALHRLIVTSATYRQSSNQRHDLAAVDPRNQLLARQVRLRLEAEVIRDVMLSAGGLLCTTIGGPSVFPYQAPGVMELRRAPVPWVMSKGPARHRRGLYTHFWRTSPHPYLVTFDAPRSEAACTRRHRSNTPLQALMTLNDPAFVECARGLATRLLREAKDEDRLQHAFRLCLARAPTATERRVLDEFLARQRQEFGADPQAARKLAGLAVAGKTDVQEFAAWTALARVLLNLDEFITRE